MGLCHSPSSCAPKINQLKINLGVLRYRSPQTSLGPSPSTVALILLPAAGLGAELPSSRLGGKSAAGDGEDHAGVLGSDQAERQRELCTRRTEPGTARG